MKPEKTYLICATPRSGSSLISLGLARTQLAGQPDEYFDVRTFFNWTNQLGFQAGNFAEYVQGLFEARTVAGVFGAKILWYDMENCFAIYPNTIPELAGKPLHEQLDRLFNHPRYIFLVRRDRVRQAVSMVRAQQTQIWQVSADSLAEKPQPAQQPYFDFNRLERVFWELTAAEQGWRDYFAASGIEPLTLVYEEFAERFEDTITDLLRYLEIDLPPDYVPPTPITQKQADALNDSWVEQYHAELKRRAELKALLEASQENAGLLELLNELEMRLRAVYRQNERLNSHLTALQGEKAALLEHRNELEARLRGVHQENAHLSSQLAALQGEKAALLEHRNELEARLRGAHQENTHLSSQLAALQAENGALRQQLEALQRQLAEMPPPLVELAARRVYRSIVPTPLRLKLRSLRTRR
jgi:LPS sulfotransferase NodH/regulator of replication initiation timing